MKEVVEKEKNDNPEFRETISYSTEDGGMPHAIERVPQKAIDNLKEGERILRWYFPDKPGEKTYYITYNPETGEGYSYKLNGDRSKKWVSKIPKSTT